MSIELLTIKGKKQPASKSNSSPVVSTEPYPNVTENKSIDFDSINELLQQVFKHDCFKTELQRDAVVEACKFNQDLFISLPTGSGKSLIYQLPAVYKNYGLTIVVSPLVALISNQIINAKKLGIPCATINSHMTKTWNDQVKTEIMSKENRLRLLYITPETLCSEHFKHCLGTVNRNKNLKLFAIDEAHCVSSWGHEFRHDYLKLSQLRVNYPNIPILALTATATTKVLKDILDTLNLRNPKHIIASTFRQNLFYDVKIVEKLDGGVLNDLTIFLKECLKIKKEPVKEKQQISKKVDNQEKSNEISFKGSQFVTAASLLVSEHDKPSESGINGLKGRPKHQVRKEETKILVNEAPKITSFFKVKPVELIDLSIEDDDSKTKDDGSDSDVMVIEGPHPSQFKSALELKKQLKDELNPLPKKPSQKVESSFSSALKLKRETEVLPEVIESPIKKVKVNSKHGVGIVYCRTKQYCEDVAEHLDRKGIPSRPYHSGLTSKQRSEIEISWMDEKVLVICATISFGMGIDKANVRAVVHFNMSQSLANYYQESGRAGRDGKQAFCRLYYSQSDQAAITFLLRKDIELENSGQSIEKYGAEVCKKKQKTARAALERFERMVNYCGSSNRCRHLVLAREFALEEDSKSTLLANGCGKSCDHCIRVKSGSQTSRSTPSLSSSSSSSSPLSAKAKMIYAAMQRRSWQRPR